MSSHQDAANLAAKRRIQDSINRAAALLVAHNEENAHTDQLRDEYWMLMRRPLTVTVALTVIDNDDLTPTGYDGYGAPYYTHQEPEDG